MFSSNGAGDARGSELEMPLFRLKRIAFLVAAVALATSTATHAEMLYLKCGDYNLFAVDLTNHTVNGKPAEITPISIDWHTVNSFGDSHMHIDRAAGTLTNDG